MNIHVIIPVHNEVEETVICLETLRKQSISNLSVYVVDDGSTDGTASVLAHDFPEVVVISGSGDLWWTGAIHKGVQYICDLHLPEDDRIVTLNNDVVLGRDCLKKLLDFSIANNRSIVTALSVDIADRETAISSGSRMRSWLFNISNHPFHGCKYADIDKHPVKTDMLVGRTTMYPVSLVAEIGNYDQKHFPHYGADNEFTIRASRQGWSPYILPEAIGYVNQKRTGLNPMSRHLTVKEMFESLFSIRSVNNLAMRTRFAWYCCPRYAFLTYALIMYLKIFTQLVLGNLLVSKKS